MKPYISYLFYALLFVMSFQFTSCDKMDDIQKQYADEEEIIYLGKIDSVKVIPGFGRVKLTWEVSADPRIQRVRVYWNNNAESIVKEFNRSVSGPVKDSIFIENLPEGNYTFELRSESDEYNPSLPTIASGTVWGPNRGDDLGTRTVNSFDLDVSEATFTLGLSPVQQISAEDSMVFSEINYTTTTGADRTIRIHPDSSQAFLEDFATGEDFTIRDAFVSTIVIDTVYNNYREYISPQVVQGSGQLLDVKGQEDSKVFAVSDSVFMEWTVDGALVSYNWDGSMVSSVDKNIVGEISRDSFEHFFHYTTDKYIGITHDGKVFMHQVVNDTLTNVLTPSGEEAMGTGFVFEQFVPGIGYFYSVTSGTGELKTWFAQENATWGSPNGSTVATNFHRFRTMTLFNTNLLAIDHDGDLWYITVRASGEPNVYRKIGSGWDRFQGLVAVGTSLVAYDDEGNIYSFEQFNTETEFRVID